jgi:hypothetical protein
MMKHFLLALLLYPLDTVGQEELKISQLPSIKQQHLNKRLNQRNKNESFLQQTLNYSALSFATGPFMDLGSPKKWYILSSDIIPQFVIGGRWMPFPIHFTPRFKARILRNNHKEGDSSFPVRTPSFMPGATIYFPMTYKREEDLKIRFGSLSVFHHSNGQDQPEFKTNGEINTYNGNFSTNYVEPAFYFRNRKSFNAKKERFRCNDGSSGYLDVYGRIGGEFHFLTAANLRNSYGKTRVNGQLGWIWVKNYSEHINKIDVGRECYLKETDRFVLNTTFITGNRTRGLNKFEKRINLDANYYVRIPTSPNAAGFLCLGYYGSDPYNIYYENNYFYFRMGLALGFFVYPGLQHHKNKK